MDFLPPEDEALDRTRFSVRLAADQAEAFRKMAVIWNALDAATGRKRRRKWQAASVIERMLQASASGFYAEIGGPQRTSESEAEFVRRAVVELKKRQK